ncbi:DUF6483 family protein [Paenibacillus protaetiae]|uniref:Tetratricopeptide repeat protein n=1 Tax=Paenibacillus protaetiae TaxID=2509456 RepID=A0A4P6EV55_9BACL|nr:DUF6483 family protein [Paenibacillus protaetiae]QAY66892.1 hypothetical protein ET464_11300 [Paenibacillus protaetiae]
MFQRDFFMRMIEQMTEAAGQIMQLRKEQKQAEAIQLIDDLLDKDFGLSSKLLRSLSDEDLVAVMTTNGVVQTDQLQAIALLFKQQGELYEDLGQENEAYTRELQALQLFMRLTLLDAPTAIADSAKEAGELLDKLSDYELPIQTRMLEAEWHEATGRYDLAENTLYELLEDEGIDWQVIGSFYSRIRLIDDDTLEEGGLPRDEVDAAYVDLVLKYNNKG